LPPLLTTLAEGHSIEEATGKEQSAIDKVNIWTKRWRIKLNEAKSVHVNFTNKKVNYLPVSINQQIIPHENSAKYLGMTLDAKLRWKVHIKKKREELKQKFRKCIGFSAYIPSFQYTTKYCFINKS
jgi:predicted GIY-YIG superfamily endonuclease